jgi:aldose 1-epimerase
MNPVKAMILLLAASLLFGCSREAPPEPESAETAPPADEAAEAPVEPAEEPRAPMAGMDQEPWGVTRDGKEAALYKLGNGTGMVVEISNYGGIIRALTAPDRNGVYQDVVLGYDTLAEYEDDEYFMGALIGRYANRIANGQFELDGVEYALTVNDPPNHLHGGERGFGKVVWEAYPSMSRQGPSLLLYNSSADGEEGYPGKVSVNVRYTLTWDSKLIIEFEAKANQATPINLTQHTYFNLSGNARRDILGHRLEIAADSFTPIDSSLIPIGEIRPVEGTPFDFREAKIVGEEIDMRDQQLEFGGGYDHNWVTDSWAPGRLRHVATLSDPETGRVLSIQSTEPGLQFYSGNFLNPTVSGKGARYPRRHGLCLETQHFPDSPNQPSFPSSILRPDEKFESRTTWTFTVAEQAVGG